MKSIRIWLQAARAPFFTGSLAPILVGTAAGYYAIGGPLQWDLALLALISLTLLHASANLFNDFFDHLSGTDDINVSYLAPFTGGSRVIQQGLARPWQVLVGACVCIGLAAVIGFYLVYRAGWPVLCLGLIGGLTGFFYTAPPFKFSYRGGGELFIFLDFGLLPVLGAYYLQIGHFDTLAVWASLPVALLITDILWINQFQDADADAAVKKRHWVVRLGRKRSAWVHVGLLAATYVCIIVPVMAGTLPLTALLALLGALPAIKAAVTAVRHYDDLPALAPANAATVAAHLLTSVLLAVGLAW